MCMHEVGGGGNVNIEFIHMKYLWDAKTTINKLTPMRALLYVYWVLMSYTRQTQAVVHIRVRIVKYTLIDNCQ